MPQDRHDTEDKGYWVIAGRKKEDVFVEQVCPALGLSSEINPEKESDPLLPDIIVEGKFSDLKCQNTPFFKSGMYGRDSQFAVTFNHKDYWHYKKRHPEIDIFYWVHWTQLEMENKGSQIPGSADGRSLASSLHDNLSGN
jgi:hypothetical protein